MSEKTDVSLTTKTILLTGILTGVSANAIVPCIPQMKIAFQDIAYSDFLVKMMFTISPLFGAISSFFIGIFLDRLGRKTVIICSLLISVTGIVAFFTNSLYMILTSRIFVGIGLGGSLTGFTTLIGDYFEGRRLDKFMGLRSSFVLIGSILFLTLGGILADIDWHLVFLLCGISVFVAIGVQLFIDEPEAMNTSGLSGIKEPLPKNLNFIFILAFLSGLPYCMVYVYTPFYLRSLMDASATKISLALTGVLVSGAITAMSYQKLRTCLSFQRILTTCLLSISAGFFIIAASDSYYHVVSGLAVVGIGFGLFMPTLNILTVSSVSSLNRGRAVGSLNIFLSTGPFFTLIILQFIVNQIGISRTFIAMGVLSLTSIGLLRKSNITKYAIFP